MSIDIKSVEDFGLEVHELHHKMWQKVMAKVNKQEHDKALLAIQKSKNELSELTNNFYANMSALKY